MLPRKNVILFYCLSLQQVNFVLQDSDRKMVSFIVVTVYCYNWRAAGHLSSEQEDAVEFIASLLVEQL